MSQIKIFLALVLCIYSTSAFAGNKINVVLVHGAFADGSGWSDVIPLLQKKGYFVTAVQNPLSSWGEDVATTKRVLDSQTGPIILVGHSYGGAVITEAAAGNENVKALVYVAAFAPEAKENLGELHGKYGASPLFDSLVVDGGGFASIMREKYPEVFAGDLALSQSEVMAAAQKPAHGKIFSAVLSAAAWKTIPSWYVVAERDQVILPKLQHFMADRMKATKRSLFASHVAFISQAGPVVEVIEEAVSSLE